MEGALSGIVVADFTHQAAGPYCTMLMADLGARVIKIEQPGSGDAARAWGTHRFGDRSILFVTLNRNKESLAADMKDASDRAVVVGLLERCDVVIESFSTGVAERLGIAYEDVRALNPRAVYCSLSGYGRTGPLRDLPGFDMAVQAYAGPMSITGEPGRPPVRMGPAAIDLMTGALAFGAINAALVARQRTGEGQFIDVSLFDTAVSLMNFSITEYFVTGLSQGPLGGEHPHLSPYGVFKASDGYWLLCTGSDRLYRKFVEGLCRFDLADDPRFSTNSLRVKNRVALRAILQDIFATQSVDHWVALAEKCSVPASRINSVEQVAHDPHAEARETIVELPGLPGIKVPGIPFKFSSTPGKVWREPPSLGQDTAQIRKWLGFDE